MNYEMQQAEIATIRKRTITVNLSDADCDRLLNQCGEYGLTINELLASFIGDLVDGTYTSGRDERMYAKGWFERCFAFNFQETLLSYLISKKYDPESYVFLLCNIEEAEKKKRKLLLMPERSREVEEEIAWLEEEIADDQEEIEILLSGWEPKLEPNMDEEITRIKTWVKQREEFIHA